MESPSPVPCPMGLVVKKGSKTREMSSEDMPTPVSVTHTATYWPGATSRWAAA
jgi:hypothetical protein